MVKIVDVEEQPDGSDDDDCVEIDPAEFAKKLNLKETDDVILVAAKGKVALRDFPHPRHLCGNFPFDKTPHESLCGKCYCSLCDVPASNCMK
ncbi:uncharacterized protein LOC120651585 isoform X2 [Panicum virgatum]|uniref:uncharacterized protein LOC120651585 isoform X2 n=1 Tax=Panicum virgatum TaxID=38727 RepID=UPI0019D5855B|nr:uncharacterized protein LOC120651585 isoform X2 [Panicum virgatum]